MEHSNASPAVAGTSTELYPASGMSLRDYFAAPALQGLIASTSNSSGFPDPVSIAKRAYDCADAMLDRR
ncbi:conserved protein of unknown function [Acidithiobacillus ferrivorans]|uniref:Uncharacterized protein n=1 Tax=Acidithiobacillus ferrivorans TaxID=160808 RepID=A0A060UV35_9PROT|nr:hypothetical protein [Acidithiobacillus ferrivorans]CDQ10628.1 hypothetical protein AFERRI_400409 [Acidithiobacillus ferrivorans]SMH64657.1 conserved protein of unknown function [Acidithiobacillus ferrivorans]